MSEDSSPKPPSETPDILAPSDDADVTVGPVNVAFTPLEPEQIAASEPASAASQEKDAGPGEQKTQAAPPPPLQPASSSNDALLGCLRDILLVLLAVILAAAFVFAILFAINGTLMLNDREKTTQLALEQARMKQQLADADARIAAQQSALADIDARFAGVEKRLDAMAADQEANQAHIEALQARADEIEQAAEAIRQKLTALQAHQQATQEDVAALEEQVNALEKAVQDIQNDIADFQKVTERFNRFVEGLTQLIAEVAAEEVTSQVGATPAAETPQPELTLTPQATSPITSTAPLPPTVELTPTVEASPTPASETLRLFPPTTPLPTPAFDRGVIYGLVWLDANDNGQPDPGEQPVSGAVVALKTAEGRRLLNMITGPDGRYAFINVPPALYQVELLPTADQTLSTEASQQARVMGGDLIEVNFGLR